jgi:hypothetical protein
MMHIKQYFGISLLILLLSFLAGCVTLPTKEELAALDYGECPRNHVAKIKGEFQSGLITKYSDDLIIWSPQRYWYKATPIKGGGLYVGYLVPVMVEQTFGPKLFSGKQLYGMLFKNDELIYTINPMGMQNLSIKEAVGPFPKDERDWIIGNSGTTRGNSFIWEYVLPGETVQNWSELVTVKIFRSVPLETTPDKFIADKVELYKTKEPMCAVVLNKILTSTKTEVLYEQTLADCAPYRDEFSIRKIIRGARAITDVSYSKTTAMNDAERRKWAEIIGRTKLLNECHFEL